MLLLLFDFLSTIVYTMFGCLLYNWFFCVLRWIKTGIIFPLNFHTGNINESNSDNVFNLSEFSNPTSRSEAQTINILTHNRDKQVIQ